MVGAIAACQLGIAAKNSGNSGFLHNPCIGRVLKLRRLTGKKSGYPSQI